MKNYGFTLIELILYLAIVAIILTSIIPFAWGVIGSGVKSRTQEEVFSNARYISERIKYEIRNSYDINSITNTQIVLCQNPSSCATNPTTITFSSPNIIIQNKGGAVVNLNSADVAISAPSGIFFVDYSGGSTKNILYQFTAASNLNSNRSEYTQTVSFEGAAEVRSN